MFCAVLASSPYRFVRFAADQRQETTLSLLAECLEELGGVPGVVLTDRMASLRAQIVANVVVPHPDYSALRHPLRVPPRLLRGHRPRVQDSGSIWSAEAPDVLDHPGQPGGGEPRLRRVPCSE